MKWSLLILILLISCRPHRGLEGTYTSSVIYGTDDRYPMEEFPALETSYQATLVKLSPQAIYPLPEILYKEPMALISWKDLTTGIDPKAEYWQRRQYPLCESEKFRGDAVAGSCSGVLIAPDLMLTASHCVPTESECSRNFWAFDYRQENSLFELGISFDGSTADHSQIIMIKESSIQLCSKVLIAQNREEEDHPERLDFALIQLGGYVSDRMPIRFASDSIIEPSEIMSLLGYPLGLTGKVGTNVQIIDNSSKNFFLTDADSYIGNSGSPVVNSQTGELEGILVGGEDDLVLDQELRCLRSRVLSSAQGVERVTRIQAILDYIELNAENGKDLIRYIKSSQPAKI